VKNPCNQCREKLYVDGSVNCYDTCNKRAEYQEWYKANNKGEIDRMKKSVARLGEVLSEKFKKKTA
jgi:hypothetical protein